MRQTSINCHRNIELFRNLHHYNEESIKLVVRTTALTLFRQGFLGHIDVGGGAHCVISEQMPYFS